jgi:hypothetical protein
MKVAALHWQPMQAPQSQSGRHSGVPDTAGSYGTGRTGSDKLKPLTEGLQSCLLDTTMEVRGTDDAQQPSQQQTSVATKRRITTGAGEQWHCQSFILGRPPPGTLADRSTGEHCAAYWQSEKENSFIKRY